MSRIRDGKREDDTCVTFMVLILSSATLFILGLPAWWLGKQSENDRRFLRNYRVPSQWEHVQGKMDYALSSTEYNDVIFLGSSSCEMGVNAKQFDELTGLRSYNLAAQGMLGIDAFTLILESYLAHHPTPRIVVFCVHPLEFESQDISPEARRAREHFHWCYGPVSESARPRHDFALTDFVREGIRIGYGSLRGGTTYFTNAPQSTFGGGNKSFNSWLNDMHESRGFWEVPAPVKRQVPVFRSQLTMSPTCRDKLHTLARITSEHGILLMIRPAPVMLGMFPDRMASFESDLDKFAEMWPKAFVNRPILLPLESSLFRDAVHCHAEGAASFTAFLVRAVPEELLRR